MQSLHPTPHTAAAAARRGFLFDALGLTLSAGTVALLAGRPRLARAAGDAEAAGDAAILATAVAAEHQAVAAYQAGADSGLLAGDARRLALQFQGHHRAHAGVLIDVLQKLGGTPPEPPADYGFPLDSLKQPADVLAFAAGLERGAVTAYAGAIPRFADRDLAQAAASILADEAMHWAVLRQALGQDPVPGAFFS